MRTLQTLRSSCVDGQKLIEYNMVEHANENGGATALTVATHTEAIESGFYLLSGSIYFEFKTDNAYFPLSTVHEMFALHYTDTTNEPQTLVLDVTNSFVSATATANAYTAGKWYVNKPVYIHENVGGFSVVMSATEFDGVNEPTHFTGSSSDGFQSTFKSFEWSDDLHWNDILLTNTNTTTSSVIESSLTQFTLSTIVVDADKAGAMFNASVQFQCFTPIAYADAGVSAGPVDSFSSLGACHLILKKNGVEVNRSSIASSTASSVVGVYKSQLTISSQLDAGTYVLYASGCGLYSGGAKSHIGNTRGVIDLLVSRTTGGTVNSFNTADSALSYATIAEPVLQEINIDGTTTQSGTYLYQSVSSGLNHLPNFKYNADMSSLELRRIF